MKRLLTFLALALLVGCRDPIQTQIKTLVGQRLKDPASAVYSDVRVHPDRHLAVACGKVNAKNSFGAYEGDKMFILYSGLVRFEQPDDNASLSECCDVLMANTPPTLIEFESAPNYSKTCGRLRFLETLR